MADPTLQEKQRKRQKAVKDPVCAARIIRNPLYSSGWSGKLSPDHKIMATSFLDDAAAMYTLQINRDREVGPLSLQNALFWEHHQMADHRLVATPALIWEQQQQLNEITITTGVIYAVPFFSANKSSWKESFQKVVKQQSPSSSSTLEVHHFFTSIRDREFTVWPVLMDGFWVTIIMRVEPMDTPEFEHGGSSNYYFDRNVTKLAIVDPVYEESEERKDLVFKRLRSLLRQGCIRLSEDALTNTLRCDQVESDWETGYVAYAISREFLRRLKVLTHRRWWEVSGPDSESEQDLLWSAFEETHRVDGYRESLLAATSNYVIEASGYRIRSALEVPSEKADHSAEKLRPAKDSGVSDEKINIGDQSRRFELKMVLPEGYSRESSIENQPEPEPEEDETDSEGEGGISDEEVEIILKQTGDRVEEKKSSEVPEAVMVIEASTTATIATPPKSPEPDTRSQKSASEPPANLVELDGGADSSNAEDKLRAAAAAAGRLAEEMQASKESSEDVVMEDAEPEVPSETPGTPITQQATHPVDYSRSESPEQEIQIAGLNAQEDKPEDATAEPPQIQQGPHHDAHKDNVPSPSPSPSLNEPELNTSEPEQDQTSSSPVRYQSPASEVEVPETQDARPEYLPQPISWNAINEAENATAGEEAQGEGQESPVPDSVPETQDAATVAPIATDSAEPVGVEPSSEVAENNEGDVQQPTAAEAAGNDNGETDADGGKDGEKDNEYESIFGNGSSPAAADSDDDVFIPEDEAETFVVPPPPQEEEAAEEEDAVVVHQDAPDAGQPAAPTSSPVQPQAPMLSPPLQPQPQPVTSTSPGTSVATTVIPGLSMVATPPQSTLGKRGRDEDEDADGEAADQPSPKRQKERTPNR